MYMIYLADGYTSLHTRGNECS